MRRDRAGGLRRVRGPRPLDRRLRPRRRRPLPQSPVSHVRGVSGRPARWRRPAKPPYIIRTVIRSLACPARTRYTSRGPQRRSTAVNTHLKTIVIWLVVIARDRDRLPDLRAPRASQQAGPRPVGVLRRWSTRARSRRSRHRRRRRLRDPGEVQGAAARTPTGSRSQDFTTYIVKDERSLKTLRDEGRRGQGEEARATARSCRCCFTWSPMLLIFGVWIFFMRQMQSGGNKALSASARAAREAASAQAQEGHLQGRGRRRRGQGGAAGDHRVPEGAAEVPEARRPDPQGRAADRAPRAPARRCWRRAIAGEANVPFFSISGSDFVEMFVGVGASPRARPVRAGQEERALHHLHRRDRRRRPPPRRRPRRRPRRARADAQPAAGRDGRLRDRTKA